jgi:hypothetical protein
MDSEDEETALWRRTMEVLLERGATVEEAIDGANLVVQAYRRQRDEARRRLPPERKEPNGE